MGAACAVACAAVATGLMALLQHLKERQKWPPIASFTKSEVAQFWLEGLNWKAVFLASKEAEEKGKASLPFLGNSSKYWNCAVSKWFSILQEVGVPCGVPIVSTLGTAVKALELIRPSRFSTSRCGTLPKPDGILHRPSLFEHARGSQRSGQKQ